MDQKARPKQEPWDDGPMGPDNECKVCGTTRENHGDKHHEFSNHGDLIEKAPAPPATKAPPRLREEEVSPTAKSMATLLEVLAEKGILDAKDIIRILSGNG